MAGPKMELEDWLDDLCVRFIINIPTEDLSSVARICFHVEEAQWFYEDFIRPLDPTLPSMSLRTFCMRIFQHCPLLASFPVENHMRAFEEFLEYKTRIPVRGAIMLNHAMDSTVLVKGWKKNANWSFPRGKINKDEDDLDCAIREVYEETGFDIRAAGLVPKNDEVKYIEILMREHQHRLYVFRNVPMDTHFEPKTRKEISKIQWYKLSELPAFRKKGNHQNDRAADNANKFYMVAPFLVPLKKWVVQQKKRDVARAGGSNLAAQPIHEEPVTEDDLAAHGDDIISPAEPTPVIDTFEGANRELKRLLNMQPQAAQVPAATPETVSDNGRAKGSALLALLQSGSTGTAPQPTQQPQQPPVVPHTPLDHILSGALPPQPRTPHHHHTTQHSYHQAPPPAFPLGPQSAENQPAAFHPPHIPSQASSMGGHGAPLFPGMPQGMRQEGPYHGQPQPSHIPPFQRPMHQGQQLPPLPNPTAHGNHEQLPFQQAHVQGAASKLSPEKAMPMPQLNSHSMSLLSALRGNVSRPAENGSASQPNPASSGQTARVVSMPHPTAPVTAPPSLPNIHPRMASASYAGLPIPVQPDTQAQANLSTHRSALLDMFKAPASASPTQVTSLPISNLDGTAASPAMQFAATQQRPQQQPSTAEAIRAAAQANGGAVLMDPNLNLPFGALKLLSRPKELEAGHNLQASAVQPLRQPSHLRQVKAAPAKQTQPPAPQYGQQSATLGHQQQLQPPSPMPANLQVLLGQQEPVALTARQPEASLEQKNLLLSLFGKQSQQQSPAAVSAILDKGKGKEAPLPMPSAVPLSLDYGSASRPLSRVATIASAAASASGGEGSVSTSRRGSQTPMSPADRSFLLGYLQSVSNSATQ